MKMRYDMELIKCGSAQYEAVTGLYHRVTAYLQAHINYPRWDSAHPSDKGVADAIEQGAQYACVYNGEIRGTVALSEDPEGDYDHAEWSADLRKGEYLVIHALAVHPGCSGKGIGGFMVEQCISIAKKKGYKALRLDVVPGNIPAERLYMSRGFAYTGTVDLHRDAVGIPLFDLYELLLAD